jgi:HAUS augmin-like complex subunit 1
MEEWAETEFSPSKARQHALQAKDWAYINAWLVRKHAPGTVPSFERNQDTLDAFMKLAEYDDRVGQEQNLRVAVENAAVDEYRQVGVCTTCACSRH